MLAFDLGDLYRTPVMVLADGQLGQMMEPARSARRHSGSCRRRTGR